jgi:hypothetical protein
MVEYSIDVRYAYAQLGLDDGSSLDAIQAVLACAIAYRYFTKARIDLVQEYTGFFIARSKLGSINTPFSDIKKAYHKKAMALHPDRNRGDKETEDQLKDINGSYALVEAMNRTAKAYYKQSEDIRRELERKAREATENEKPEPKPQRRNASNSARHAHFKSASHTASARARPTSSSKLKYMAAAIPRSIRAARLGHLSLHAIIGCKFTPKKNDLNLVFDIVMLPEKLFRRARSYLAVPDMAGVHLTYGNFSPPYIIKDFKEVVVPDQESDPERYAREHFIAAFGL